MTAGLLTWGVTAKEVSLEVTAREKDNHLLIRAYSRKVVQSYSHSACQAYVWAVLRLFILKDNSLSLIFNILPFDFLA